MRGNGSLIRSAFLGCSAAYFWPSGCPCSWACCRNYKPEDREQQFHLEEKAKAELQRMANFLVIAVDAEQNDKGWRVLAEVVGPQAVIPQQVRAIQDRLSARFKLPVEMDVKFRSEVMVNSRGYHSPEAE